MKLSVAIACAMFMLVFLTACESPTDRANEAVEELIEDAQEDVFGTPTPQSEGVPTPPGRNAPLETPSGTSAPKTEPTGDSGPTVTPQEAGTGANDGSGEGGDGTASFVSVSAGLAAGLAHTCGVKKDGSVACWGNDEYGRATPPAGEFASVSAGWYHTCGVRRDGSVACWGNDEYSQATPPAGEFASVSAGVFHTCGVKTDGSVACWGNDEYSQATPPAGEFSSVSAGPAHTCGVRDDGSIALLGLGFSWPGHAAWRGVRLRQRRGVVRNRTLRGRFE